MNDIINNIDEQLHNIKNKVRENKEILTRSRLPEFNEILPIHILTEIERSLNYTVEAAKITDNNDLFVTLSNGSTYIIIEQEERKKMAVEYITNNLDLFAPEWLVSGLDGSIEIHYLKEVVRILSRQIKTKSSQAIKLLLDLYGFYDKKEGVKWSERFAEKVIKEDGIRPYLPWSTNDTAEIRMQIRENNYYLYNTDII